MAFSKGAAGAAVVTLAAVCPAACGSSSSSSFTGSFSAAGQASRSGQTLTAYTQAPFAASSSR